MNFNELRLDIVTVRATLRPEGFYVGSLSEETLRRISEIEGVLDLDVVDDMYLDLTLDAQNLSTVGAACGNGQIVTDIVTILKTALPRKLYLVQELIDNELSLHLCERDAFDAWMEEIDEDAEFDIGNAVKTFYKVNSLLTYVRDHEIEVVDSCMSVR